MVAAWGRAYIPARFFSAATARSAVLPSQSGGHSPFCHFPSRTVWRFAASSNTFKLIGCYSFGRQLLIGDHDIAGQLRILAVAYSRTEIGVRDTCYKVGDSSKEIDPNKRLWRLKSV